MQDHGSDAQLWAHLFDCFLYQAIFELLLAMDVAAASGNRNSVELSETLLFGYSSVFEGTLRHSLAIAYLF